jgi:hypothetical protein
MRQYPRQAIGAEKAPAWAGVQLGPFSSVIFLVSYFLAFYVGQQTLRVVLLKGPSSSRNAIFTPLNLCLTTPIFPTEGKKKQSEDFLENAKSALRWERTRRMSLFPDSQASRAAFVR